jgi:uncharacterized membrane protein
VDVTTILDALQGSAVAHSISKTNHLVGAALQILHILGFVLLLAALLLASLRLLGWTLRDQPVTRVTRDAMRLVWTGLALAVPSGVLMFVATPKLYFYNAAFGIKMVLFVIAVLVQVFLFRRVAAQDAPSPARARASVAASLAAWFGIGVAGRMIGFL